MNQSKHPKDILYLRYFPNNFLDKANIQRIFFIFFGCFLVILVSILVIINEGTYYRPGRPCACEQGSQNRQDVAGMTDRWDVASSGKNREWVCLRQRNRFRRNCATISPDNNEQATACACTCTVHRGRSGACDA